MAEQMSKEEQAKLRNHFQSCVVTTALILQMNGHGPFVAQLVKRANAGIPWNYCPTCEESRPMTGTLCLCCGQEAKPIEIPERMILSRV